MAQYQPLDSLFLALSDPTRRAVIGRLSRGPASISELASPFDMALPSFMKHIHQLEQSGWIRSEKLGRVRTCRLETASFGAAQAWLDGAAGDLGGPHRPARGLRHPHRKGEIEMNAPFNPDLDLSIERVIKAPRSAVWHAWTDQDSFAQWWVPAPAVCRVAAMDLVPGGGLVTEISENGSAFGPHLDACYLAIEPEHRLIFTNAMTAGWRPAADPFITAIITLADHADGTLYSARVMHKSSDVRQQHADLGFYDGWGTVATQLASLVERSVQ